MSIPTGRRVAVVQAYEADETPAWIERCVDSVRQWSQLRGFEHHFFTSGFFSLAPDWFRARCGEQIGPLTDAARVQLMRHFHGEGYDEVVWVDADVLVFDPQRLDVASSTGFLAIEEVTVGLKQDGAVHVSPRGVNGALLLARRGHPLFEFYIYAMETAVRRHPDGAIPRTIAGPQLLTRISGVVGIECLTTVGLFTPVILLQIAEGKERMPAEFARHFGHRVAAANLCHFYRAEFAAEQRLRFDRVMDTAIDRLLETRGDVVNRHLTLPRADSQSA